MVQMHPGAPTVHGSSSPSVVLPPAEVVVLLLPPVVVDVDVDVVVLGPLDPPSLEDTGSVPPASSSSESMTTHDAAVVSNRQARRTHEHRMHAAYAVPSVSRQVICRTRCRDLRARPDAPV
jgi:hypothetical protein